MVSTEYAEILKNLAALLVTPERYSKQETSEETVQRLGYLTCADVVPIQNHKKYKWNDPDDFPDAA